jgi:DNA-binding transcriptional LysR family regulator
MNYNNLKYFTVVAQTLNISKAASSLFISQPALSSHIRNLEKELGIQLFIRTNRDLILTEAGNYLLQETLPFFNRESRLIQKVREIGSAKKTVLKIGLMGFDAIYRLPALLDSFKKNNPAIEVSVKRLNWEPLMHSLTTGKIDVGFSITQQNDYPSTIASYVLSSCHLAAVLPATHPLTKKKVINMEELRNEKFIFLTRDSSRVPHDDAINLCRNAGFEPNIIAEYPLVETVMLMVNVGEGIALLSHFAPTHGFDNVRFVDIENSPSVYLKIMWVENNKNNAVKLFIDTILSADWNLQT